MRPPATDLEVTIALRRLVVGVLLIGLAVVLGAFLMAEVDPLDVDVAWNAAVAASAPVLQPLALVLNAVGGGWIAIALPVVGALALATVRRPLAGAFLAAASLGSVVVVQVLKTVFGRERPEDILVISDHGSFPSGHTANAATLAAVAVILLPRLWVVLVSAAWTLLMAFSRTQVHAHWLSDTLGGTLVGVGAALVVAAAIAVPMAREQEGRRSLG